jgi:hypothetical protein
MMVRLLLASLIAVGLASAQGRNGGGGGDMGGDPSMGGGMPRAQRQSRTDIIADKLHLSKDQKTQAAAIFSSAQEEATPINEQIKQGRNSSRDATRSPARFSMERRVTILTK